MEIMGFRSTGSYEPDQRPVWTGKCDNRFDPQALTSLTAELLKESQEALVSIHRLLRA